MYNTCIRVAPLRIFTHSISMLDGAFNTLLFKKASIEVFWCLLTTQTEMNANKLCLPHKCVLKLCTNFELFARESDQWTIWYPSLYIYGDYTLLNYHKNHDSLSLSSTLIARYSYFLFAGISSQGRWTPRQDGRSRSHRNRQAFP